MENKKHSSEIEHLNALYEITAGINFSISLNQLLDKIMTKVCKILNAEAALSFRISLSLNNPCLGLEEDLIRGRSSAWF